jgi:hypothetical protein
VRTERIAKTQLLEGSSRKQGFKNMYDISHAIHAKCGTLHVTEK